MAVGSEAFAGKAEAAGHPAVAVVEAHDSVIVSVTDITESLRLVAGGISADLGSDFLHGANIGQSGMTDGADRMIGERDRKGHGVANKSCDI